MTINNILITTIAVVVTIANSTSAQQWTQFRGPNGTSVSGESVPTTFDEKNNLAWRRELPGRGVGGAIVVDNKVIVTSSSGEKQDELSVSAFDSATGKSLWTQKFWATGRCLCHPTSANAAPTPVSDGKNVYAFYSSNDLACLDLDGNLVWFRGLAVDRPKAGNDVGMSSSPAVHDGVVVVQVEGHGDAFVMGLDAANGKTLWTKERLKDASWASPLIISPEGQPAKVAIQSAGKFSILNLKSGETLFEEEGDVSTISSSAFIGGKLLVPCGGTTAYDLKSDGTFHKAWVGSQIKPASASGVTYDGKIYTLNRAGVLSGFSIDTGEEVSKARVGGSYWATPAVAGNHMYFFAQDGTARVVDLETMKVVHDHKFEDDEFLGSPAVHNGAMFIRSAKFLYKIAKTDATQP